MSELAMATEAALIDEIRDAASDPRRRTKGATQGESVPALPPPATAEQLARVHATIEFELHPFHQRLLREVADGGFGPSYGMIGIAGARSQHGRTLIETFWDLRLFQKAVLPLRLVPLIDWSPSWCCVGSTTGILYTLTEKGAIESDLSLRDFFSMWVHSEDYMARLFVVEMRAFMNPFTRKEQTARWVGPPRGKLVVPLGANYEWGGV